VLFAISFFIQISLAKDSPQTERDSIQIGKYMIPIEEDSKENCQRHHSGGRDSVQTVQDSIHIAQG